MMIELFPKQDTIKQDDMLIISMTSYQPRIKYVADVCKSILSQNVNVDFKLVVVLAIPNFPNKESELPNDLVGLINDKLIEII